MQSRTLGRTGLQVSAVGLGGMPLSLKGRPDEDQAIRVIHAAIDHGMTLIDTADVYCVDHSDIGHNERLIARALRESNADPIMVTTKGGLERPDGAWTENGHPDHLRAACEASLRALGVEQITLYQLHAPDDRIPFADSVGALAELQQEGKIGHVGLSNVYLEEIIEARKIVEVVSVQNRCNVFDRESFSYGIVDYCTEHGITFLPHTPVGGSSGQQRVRDNATLATVGERHNASTYEIAIAWLLHCSPAMIPIPGASKIPSAVSSARAANVQLSAEDMTLLDEAFPRQNAAQST
jgi:aryl-alcohol dehydrogenase-like predicted oxidoreductase